ncbi:glycosyltransferase [Vibrio mediterranei]|uniref:glycosyltransferase n=1 Tax=Vibrio mediterranei TaxID=689 RepID=UPI004069700E
MISSKSRTPSLSVLSANYNNAEFLSDFFDSIVKSTVQPDEIIFVDDASTDNSLEIVDRYKDKLNINLIALPENVGFANALNIGARQVKTDLVLRVDPDDIINSDRIKMQKDFLNANQDIDIVGSNVTYFLDDKACLLNNSNFPVSNENIIINYLKGEHGLIHGAVTLRTHCLDEHVYKQENVPSEEYDIFSRMLKSGLKAENIKESLTFVRIHSGSVTNNIPLSTVKKYHKLRCEIWGKESKLISIYRDFFSKRLYRKYLYTNNSLKYVYLFLLCLLNPVSAIRRVVK